MEGLESDSFVLRDVNCCLTALVWSYFFKFLGCLVGLLRHYIAGCRHGVIPLSQCLFIVTMIIFEKVLFFALENPLS